MNHPTTRGQRVLILAGLLLAALSLHVVLCDWHWRLRERFDGGGERRMLVLELSETYYHPIFGNGQPYTMGLYSGVESRAVGMLAGVVLPVLILGAGVYVVLGWRYDDRVRRRCCTRCGYDLKGASGPCPECGTAPPAGPNGSGERPGTASE